MNTVNVLTPSVLSRKDKHAVADFFIQNSESAENAIEFLESIIETIDPNRLIRKRDLSQIGVNDSSNKAKIAKPIEATEFSVTDLIADLIVGDSLDDGTITSLIQIPNEIGMCSHVIGKQGSGVADIRTRTGVRVRLERAETLPTQMQDRSVFMIGKLSSMAASYQLLLKRMEEKADNIPANALDALKAVVPNELVSKLIGKSGNVIKRIQSESGARTVFQTEEEMIQTTYFYGRTVTITGTVRQRCHALYLIYRQVCLLLTKM